MKVRKLFAALLTVGLMFALTACGSGNKASEENSYTMWIYSGADSTYFLDYAEHPVFQYLKSKTWGPENKAVDIEFWVPPAGTAADNYANMIATNSYADIIDSSISDSPISMYETGVVMDLTELIPQYMPNYMAWLEKYPSLKNSAYTNVNGEQKMLAIISINEGYGDHWSGNMYRRDWIVKYGKNPVTGEAFTGGFADANDVDSWTDNVVFPSGGSDPMYISDWEWMFEIFTRAQADLGITDSYSYSMFFPGYTWSGGLLSGFGITTNLWEAPETTNKVQFGGDTEGFRAYLECLNHWYDQGWLDKRFNERTSDAHYAIDDTNVRQGKVGLWLGTLGELGGRLDMHDGGYTEGICVYGATWPINDMYGDESVRNVEPFGITVPGLGGTGFYISVAAEGKDIPTLLSLFDYMYTPEGALMHSIGLNKDQIDEIDSQFCRDWGVGEGTYTQNADGRYKRHEVIENDNANLAIALALTKFPGVTLVDSVDLGRSETLQHSIDQWVYYRNHSFFQGSAVTNNMSDAETTEVTNIQTKILEYMATNCPDFIKGKKNIAAGSEDWNNWCTIMKKYNYQKVIDIFQPYVDQFDFRDDH